MHELFEGIVATCTVCAGYEATLQSIFADFDVSRMAAHCPAALPAKLVSVRQEASHQEEVQDEGGDPYLLDGNTATIHWPVEDGSVPSFTAAIRYARPGRKRCYEVAFDDGDVRLSTSFDQQARILSHPI